jgi:cell division control protein 45
MLWPADKLDIAFGQIKLTAESDALCTLILASAEPDSLCALKIVSDILKSENIAFSSKAVSNFAETEEYLRAVLTEGDVRSIILINCGGTVDLTKRFGTLLREDTFLYVMDCHRPLAHPNLHSTSRQVIVFGGEIDTLDETVPDANDPNEEELDSDDDDDDASEKPENDEPNEEETKMRRSRISPSHRRVGLPNGRSKKFLRFLPANCVQSEPGWLVTMLEPTWAILLRM